MKDVWGWESAAARAKRYARVPLKRKMEALEEMREFIVKYSVAGRRASLSQRNKLS